jgi:glycosyltransferase involved in cell wall biosynthesis
MKVLIVNNMAPFVWGGAEELAKNLEENIIKAGHEAEVLRIPFIWEPVSRIPSQMLMVRTFELINVDRVIALKFPAYLIRHPRKTLWLLHQYRQAYDLFDAGQTNLTDDQPAKQIRNSIINADNQAFLESEKVYTNSDITKLRLKKYNGYEATVLRPPVNDPELFKGGRTGDYIFVGGRINSMKRQHFLVQALSQANKSVKLLIAGPPDSKRDAVMIYELIEKYGLKDRIKLDLRFLPREVYANYINNALAVAYIPFDEDSYGYVAMEAALAGKALITTSDSGGVLGMVENKKTGWVAKPTNDSLAETLSKATDDINRAKQFGLASRAFWRKMDINWPQTVKRLLQ